MVTETRTTTESEFAVDKTNDPIVRAEIDNFEKEVLAWRAGEGLGDDFRPFRLQHGTYGQRQDEPPDDADQGAARHADAGPAARHRRLRRLVHAAQARPRDDAAGDPAPLRDAGGLAEGHAAAR